MVARNGGREGQIDRAERISFFFFCFRILCDTAVTDICHCIFVTTERIYNTKREPNVDYRIWVMRVIFTNVPAGRKIVGRGIIWENSVLSTRFCCEPKTALKTFFIN